MLASDDCDGDLGGGRTVDGGGLNHVGVAIVFAGMVGSDDGDDDDGNYA